MKVQRNEKRIQWIDFAKFLGILFVLLSHMELRIPYISDFAYLFYVPVFFVLAGYTYRQREESIGCFIKRKGKRLLVPYFGYSIVLFLFFFVKDHLLCGTVNLQAWEPLLGILYARNSLYPLDAVENVYFMTILNSPMWFLPALFLASVLFELCVRISGNSWKRLLGNNVLIMAVGILVMYLTPILLPWSLDTVCLFEVFIAAGFVLRSVMDALAQSPKIKWGKNMQGNVVAGNMRHIITIVIILFLSNCLYRFNGPMNVSVGDFGRTIVAGVLSGILSSYGVLLFCYLIRNHIPEGAALIGRSSLTIMCLHMFVYMFVKTGINIWDATLLSQNTVAAVFVKAMAVSGTLAILTIFDLCKRRKSRTSL